MATLPFLNFFSKSNKKEIEIKIKEKRFFLGMRTSLSTCHYQKENKKIVATIVAHF